MEKFLGGNPLAVMLRLVILSVVLGITLNALGYNPRELLEAIPRLLQAIYDLGFRWVDSVVDWFVLGAVIVIPAWLIIRLFKFIGGDAGKGSGQQ